MSAVLYPREIAVDNFAGGGGASTGIEAALGRPIDIAINHSPEAVAMHRANHPRTHHYCEDVWKVDPVEACAGRPVGLAWFSPTCTHFSRAKGSGLLDQKIRGLAWVVTRWAKLVRPRVIMLENVPEFSTWGPLDENGRPSARKNGSTFRSWLSKLRSYGYVIETRELVAADYGTPTTRRRLFLIARCDGEPIAWPMPTHGRGLAQAWRPAFDVIDWSIPGKSIFDRDRPHAEATLRRIAAGIQRFAIDAPEPFIVRHGHYSTITGAGLREGCGAGTFRGQPLSTPLATVCTTNDKHLVIPVITKHYGGVVGHDVRRTLGTVTAKDHHALTAAVIGGADPERVERVAAFLARYAPSGGSGRLFGGHHRIVDITTRMLQPRELFTAQGFPSEYAIDCEHKGKPLTKVAQTRLAGNSVCPQVAAALVSAQSIADLAAAS
jgi:DNA (cytosine-5)-methyltransferase 1